MPHIPLPTGMDPEGAYAAYTAAMMGMANPINAVSPPFSARPGELELLKRMLKDPSMENIIQMMAQDRLKNAAVGGRMGDVNDILQSLVTQPQSQGVGARGVMGLIEMLKGGIER